MKYTIAVDTGGTFTDVVVQTTNGQIALGKALTTPDRIYEGMSVAMDVAAEELGITQKTLLSETGLLIYGTTRSTNAIVQGQVAKTAFLSTEGFPDILVTREGGKFGPHDFTYDFPEPYIARRHTYQVPERIGSEGDIIKPLDEQAVRSIVATLLEKRYEAVAVCLIWSVANAVHERRIGEIIHELAPHMSVSLSHQLIPIVREYRRASTTAIDASIKPLMARHFGNMQEDLRAAGFVGDLLVSTSTGGCTDLDDILHKPVLTVKSGPSMAPVAGRKFAAMEKLGDDVIVCDAGGTTFDVGLIRQGELKFTRETWLGGKWMGHLLAQSSVDIRSIGAGGGSIAWVDSGGLLRVGPQSAGSDPGPACYGRGGNEPTVTDAAVVLGYIDPDYFLGGRIKLDGSAAARVIEALAQQLGMSAQEAAFGVLNVMNELMYNAIRDITVAEGFNAAEAVVVAGGGASGLGIAEIARELGVQRVVLPKAASLLSACGMQFSDIIFEESGNCVTTSARFNYEAVNETLDRIDGKLNASAKRLSESIGDGAIMTQKRDFMVEARYETQVWELDAAVPADRVESQSTLDALVNSFHQAHERVFEFRDEANPLECLNWRGRLTITLKKGEWQTLKEDATEAKPFSKRRSQFHNGQAEVPVYRGIELMPGQSVSGPAIIEEPTTTIVLPPDSVAKVSSHNSYIVNL